MIYADAYHPLYSRRLYIIARALPCFVPGCRLVPFKIAASGARALLATTKSAGFEGKRNVDSGWKRLYPTKNVRFPNKTVPISCHCEAAVRPWQSLSQRHGIPWRGTGARSKKKSLSQKTGDLLHRFAPAFLISRFCFVTRNHGSFRDDKSFRQRLPRRVQKLRPPRNDKSGGFCGKTKQFPERNV